MTTHWVRLFLTILWLYVPMWRNEKREGLRIFDVNSAEGEWKKEQVAERGQRRPIGASQVKIGEDASMGLNWGRRRRGRRAGRASALSGEVTRQGDKPTGEGRPAESFAQRGLGYPYVVRDLKSALQIMLDQYCYPNVSRYLEKTNQHYCFDKQKLKAYTNSPQCVDNCGKIIKCFGIPTTVPSKAIPVDVVNRLKIKTCVISKKQRKLDNLCGENKVFRVYKNKQYCIPHDLLDMDRVSNSCFNESSTVISCAGFLEDAEKDIAYFEVNYQNSLHLILYNLCSEELEGNGEMYSGCQDRSISNRRCLPWNSLNIKEMLGTEYTHNYCRNPEKLTTIYCFVNMNGFVFREFCETKKEIIMNDITYMNETFFNFDVTMKNVSDFRLGLFKGDCSNESVRPDDPLKEIIQDSSDYTYHNVDGEIAVTVSFKRLYMRLYYNTHFSICACYRDYYSDENSKTCLLRHYLTKVGNVLSSNPIFDSSVNVFNVNKEKFLTINVDNWTMHDREIYIMHGEHSYECRNLRFLENMFATGFQKLLNVDISKSIEKITPSLDRSKAFSTVYAYADKIFDLQTMVKRNKDFTKEDIKRVGIGWKNAKEGDPLFSFHKLSNLKNGSNLICIRNPSHSAVSFSYVGKITYNDYNTSNVKYFLKKEATVFEDRVFLKDVANFSLTDHLFSFSAISCTDTDTTLLKEFSSKIVEEAHINRMRKYSAAFFYNHFKSSFRSGPRNGILRDAKKGNRLYTFSLQQIRRIGVPLNYLCERKKRNNALSSVSLVNLSNFIFSPYEDFAHYFHVRSLPDSIHNTYLTRKMFRFVRTHFNIKGGGKAPFKMSILSLWSHEEDNYVSLWFVTSEHLTPFFLIKYDFYAPTFSFLELVPPEAPAIDAAKAKASYSVRTAMTGLQTMDNNSTFPPESSKNATSSWKKPHAIAYIYTFSTKQLAMKKYRTSNFYDITLENTMYSVKLSRTISIHKFTYQGDTFFIFLLKGNIVYLWNSHFEGIHLYDSDLDAFIKSTPIKIQCLGGATITCFVLYEFHQILWFDLVLDPTMPLRPLIPLREAALSGANPQEKGTLEMKQKRKNIPPEQLFIDKNSENNILGTQTKNVPSREVKRGYIKHIYTYTEEDLEIASEIARDMTVIRKLNEYIIYVSNSESNKLHIYSTDKSETKIEYYKYVRNEHMSSYKISSIFNYSHEDTNFINAFITNENEMQHALTSFMHERLITTKVNYKNNTWHVYNKHIEITPVIKGDRRQIKYFTITDKNDSLKGQNVVIHKKTGVIQIKLNRIEKPQIELFVTMHGLFHVTSTRVRFNVVCMNGHYFENKKCHPCPKGSYNNLKEIKKDMKWYTQCIPCKANQTTSVLIPTNEQHCLCDVGYEYIMDPKNRHQFICSPCRIGEYKDTISNKLCKGNGCIENSSSYVLGAKTEAESFCGCNPGYFLTFDLFGTSVCEKCLVHHYCPSKFEKIQKCPKHNETLQSERTDFTTIDSCLCKKGYEPINMKKVQQKGSREEHYYNLFFSTYSYKPSQIDPKHICMECNIGYYKETVSSEECKKCPNKSMNKTFGSTTIESCNSCYSGYYKDSEKVCSRCLPNHFCVGSFPPDGLTQYIGDAVICPNNSVTQEPNEYNNSFKDCLCVEGYVRHLQESYNLNEHCKLAPLNFYKDTVSNDLGTPCPSNSITLVEGAKSIHECICDKGFFYSRKRGMCMECPIGYYCPEKNSKNKFRGPIKCPENSGNVKKGSYELSNCQCNFGYTPNAPVNKVVNAYTSVRRQNNRLSSEQPSRFPSFVHFGKVLPRRNAFIHVIPNGVATKEQSETLQKTPSLLLCSRCPNSTYKSTIANEACHECPPNSVTLTNINNSDFYFCLCNEGYYLEEQTCKPCSFTKLYCQGESIFEVPPGMYNQMIEVIRRHIGSFGPSQGRRFVNSVIRQYSVGWGKGAHRGGSGRKAASQRGGHSSSQDGRADASKGGTQDGSQSGAAIQPREGASPGKRRRQRGRRRRLPISSYFGKPLPVMMLSRLSSIADASTSLFLQRYQLAGPPNGQMNQKKKQDNLMNLLLKSFFYRDNDNVVYAKYQQLVKCPDNTAIPLGVDSAQNYDDCKCAKGYYLESKDVSKSVKVCKPCKEGTFKNFVGDETSCVSCPPKSTSLEGSVYPTHCFCKEGFFYSKENCLACLEGATCKGGLYQNAMSRIQLGLENIHITAEDHVKPESKRGYYLDEVMTKNIDVSEWKFIKCPIQGACLERNKCHHSMNNYLCVECAKGYTNTFMRSVCVKCPNNTVNMVILFSIYITFCFIIILISYLNVSSGFYRRSIHSIVIKIAVNYISSMLLINILEDKNLLLPEFVHQLYIHITKLINVGESRRIISIDCLLRHYFDLSYADSFFYSSLLFFFIPVLLMGTLTFMLFVILKIYTLLRKKAIENKLDLLSIAKRERIHFLANSLEKSYSKERFIMILRYIKLQHYTWMDRAFIFFEDMIPVYVTFLFMIHAKTSMRMFQLFDCSYIMYTKNLGRYILSRVSSVQCDLKTDYLKFFILGLSGTVIWSLGIPLLSFFVLYTNRHNLFQENVRIKYGFLHNGYLPNRWYWEIIVFARKIFFLFITTVVLFPSDETNTSKLMLITFVAIFSLCVHFIFQPFDKRNFFTLNKLENMSLFIWTSTIVVTSILLSIHLHGFLNFVILFSLILLHVMFTVKLLICLFYECIDNLRRKKALFHIPLLSTFAKALVDVVQRRKRQEPLIYYDKDARQISIILPDCVVQKKKKVRLFASSFRRIFKNVRAFWKKGVRQWGEGPDGGGRRASDGGICGICGNYGGCDNCGICGNYGSCGSTHGGSLCGSREGYAQLTHGAGDPPNDESLGNIQGGPSKEGVKRRPTCGAKKDEQHGSLNVQAKKGNKNDHHFCTQNLPENQKMSFFFFLKNNSESVCANINKEQRMFAIEIYKELLDIFMKNVTLTYISEIFFEFIFKITINIGNLIDNLDQKDKIFVSMDQEQNFKNIIQWSLERMEKCSENKKLEESKIINLKNCKYDCGLLNLDVDALQVPSSLFEEDRTESYRSVGKVARGESSSETSGKFGLRGRGPELQVSDEEKEKLFSFFSDDLLDRKIPLSEFYLILTELKLKYSGNLTAYFYMFRLYKKLEKLQERKKLRRLNKKLRKCQRISDTRKKKSREQMLEKDKIKEKTALLYKEHKDLSKMLAQLKGQYINMSRNDSENFSSEEFGMPDMDGHISLSSGDSIEGVLLSMGFDQKEQESDRGEREFK
ncbi:cysteine repeat modular protein 1, putative [Plasmodium vivax]|uniref:Cysteine repeat modular protein 1, putative n=1 Tax=Plasmodium vivax TaxID=5855 RepID=A0A1G4GV26_PLAVI|nr:cysteine repeat modular protein 1, putative [Plasmodium vivax]